MPKRSAGIAIVLSALLPAGAPGAGAAPEAEAAITASGEAAVVGGNVALAQNEAVTRAMEDAVAQAAAAFLPAETASRNRDLILKRVAAPPGRFVQDYRLAKSETAGNVVRVEVRVVPRRDKVREELVRWGILFDRARRPRIELATLKERPDRSSPRHLPSPRWTERLAGRLRGLGYSVEEAGREGAQGPERDVTLWGTVVSEGKGAVTVQLQAAIEKPAARLVSARQRAALEEGEQLAAGLMATALLQELLPVWFVQAGQGRVFDVTVEGLTSGQPYKALLEAFNSGRGGFFSGVEKIYRAGAVTFEVAYDGSAAELAEAVMKLPLAVKFAGADIRGQSIRFAVK